MRADRPEVDLLLFDEPVSVFHTCHTTYISFPRVDVIIGRLCSEQNL